MEFQKESFQLGLIVGGLLGVLAMGFVVYGEHKNWRAEAAEHGCAEYDRHTGEWRWLKEPE